MDHERRAERLTVRCARVAVMPARDGSLRRLLLAAVSGVALAFGVAPLASQTPAEAEATRRAQVLASFESGKITVGDVEDVVSAKPANLRAKFASDPAEREKLLRDLVRYDLLVLEAERRGYAKNAGVDIEARSKSSELMSAALADPAKIPAADVAAQYQAQHDVWNQPLMRRASYIAVATRAEAQALITELRGKDRLEFSRAARERSQDAETRRQAGELGYFDAEGHRSRKPPNAPPLAPELVKAAYALKRPGDITRTPIQLGSSFGVLMLTSIQPANLQPLSDVEPEIRERMALTQQTQRLDQLVAELKAQHKPEVHPELIDAIPTYVQTSKGIPEGFPAAPRDPRVPPKAVPSDRY